MKFKYFLIIIVLLSFLTVSLRGATSKKTCVFTEIDAFQLKSKILSYDSYDDENWIINDFEKDIKNWSRYEYNIKGDIYVSNKQLYIKTVFDEQKHQFIRISRNIDINLSKLSVFSINISVSNGAFYHVRFIGKDLDGVEREVWWETSPLDDLSGESKWETLFVDLLAFGERATGNEISTITRMEIILDNPILNISGGEKSLSVSHIGFYQTNVKVIDIPYNRFSCNYNESFQAVIIELPSQLKSNESWSIIWASVNYSLTSDSEFEYKMYLTSERNGVPHLEAKGPIFLSHRDDFTDIYRLDFIPIQAFPVSGEFIFLWPHLSDFSIIIVKNELGTENFQTYKINSIEIMYSTEKYKSYTLPNPVQVIGLTSIMALFLIVIPNLLIIWQLRYYTEDSNKNNLKLIIFYGIIIRLLVAPFTGHPGDLDIWTQPIRLFYESGNININTYPLPFTYYILLLTYSPYVLIKLIGFNDTTFLAHRIGMLESMFIKLPFILSDVITFYYMLKIFGKFGNNTNKNFTFAMVFFLTPLAILTSSVWPLCDSIAISLFLAGVYYTFFERRLFMGGILFTLSGLTKGFGFLGLIPITILYAKEKKYFRLLITLFSDTILVTSSYLPLLMKSTFNNVPEIFMQFLRGRVGFGSKGPFIASGSYMSYLSLIGYKIEPLYLTYVLAAIVICVSIYYCITVRKFFNIESFELTLRYFSLIFFFFYLIFFRVYEHYYLWVIPILIIYSYMRGTSGYKWVALSLSLVASPIMLLSVLLTGIEYYWIPFNLPADSAIVAILPSVVSTIGLISIMNLNRQFETSKGVLLSISLISWLLLGVAYFIYYSATLFNVSWYIISWILILGFLSFNYLKIKNYNRNQLSKVM